MADREPYRRRPHDPHAANLPDGKTCGDCLHVRRCSLIFGHIPEDEVCDWIPLRFVERAALPEGEGGR